MDKKKYQIILADPPWQFKNYNDDTATNWAGKHYNLMTLEDIKNLPIKNISDESCVLFLWATFPILPKAFQVVNAWGFTYKTVAFTWVKQDKLGMCICLGMGYWTRSNAEVCLLATKGNPKRMNADIRQIVLSPRQEHSQKPSEVRERIVRLLGDLPRIELFARRKVDGWDSIGFDIDGCDIRESLDKLVTL